MSGFGTDTSPVFHMEPVGLLANQMIEYMVALKFKSLVPACRISNVHMPAWGIEHPAIDSPGPVAFARDQQHIDLLGLSNDMHAGKINRVDWLGYGQRLENFLPRERYVDTFVPPFRSAVGFGSEYLVCHVRAGEILDGSAPNYPLTPVEFFADLIAETGLKPVFMGQTAPNAYTNRLRQRFPNAMFLDTQDIVIDFETIRQSKNVVVGVSTYAWLAAWLSTTAENIFMTVSGLLNPIQTQVVDLLPFGDARFRFYLFPLNYAVPTERHAEIHRRIAPYWRYVSHDALKQMHTQIPRFPRQLETMLEWFDEDAYLAHYGDVGHAVRQGWLPNGRAHYINWGFRERRYPFAIDQVWYASEYPMAAFEVSQGDYTDLTHHYVAVGKARGYRPLPPG